MVTFVLHFGWIEARRFSHTVGGVDADDFGCSRGIFDNEVAPLVRRRGEHDDVIQVCCKYCTLHIIIMFLETERHRDDINFELSSPLYCLIQTTMHQSVRIPSLLDVRWRFTDFCDIVIRRNLLVLRYLGNMYLCLGSDS